MDDIQSLLQQPATPQAVSDLLWHFGDVANQDLIQSQTQSMPLQVDNSYPGPAFQENIESTMEPMSDFYIDPMPVSFGLTDSNTASKDQSDT